MRYSVAVALLIGPLLLWSCADATPHQADAPYQDVNDLGGEVGPEVTDIQEVPPQDVAPDALPDSSDGVDVPVEVSPDVVDVADVPPAELSDVVTDLPPDVVEPWPLPTYLTLKGTDDEARHGWDSVETWGDSRDFFKEEDYLESGRNDHDSETEAHFGSARPPAGDFLLHYGPDWDQPSPYPPVLLITGANTNANQAWAAPDLINYCGSPLFCPSTGLLQHLHAEGFRVFAITFPHMHGDNRYWAQQIGDALDIIRHRTGAPAVDVVAWSKGGFAARLYAAGIVPPGPGTSPYGDQVGKLILLGAPNGGLDYTFRYGILPSMGIYPVCGGIANAPSPHTMMTCYFVQYTRKDLSIYETEEGDFFPGQKQMLARWDDLYPVSTVNQDYHTTYHGGNGFVSSSLGIDFAMAQGSLVAAMQAKNTPPQLPIYLLCGGAQDIAYVLNETAGPSDGLVLQDSCTLQTGLSQVRETVVDEGVNHFGLPWASTTMAQITEWLQEIPPN